MKRLHEEYDLSYSPPVTGSELTLGTIAILQKRSIEVPSGDIDKAIETADDLLDALTYRMVMITGGGI